MKRLPFIFVLLLATSCAWIKSNDKALSADSLQVLDCVAGAALAGSPVEAIGCGIGAVADIVALLDAAHITPVPSPGLTAVRAKQQAARDAGTQ